MQILYHDQPHAWVVKIVDFKSNMPDET